MKNIINKLLWALKHKDQLRNLSQQFNVRDHPELTDFLKSNQQFRNMSKAFHSWKEGLKKEVDNHFIEDSANKVKRGPESKGFKKK
jgi:hypothetical protein